MAIGSMLTAYLGQRSPNSVLNEWNSQYLSRSLLPLLDNCQHTNCKFRKLRIYTPFLPQGVEIDLIFALQAMVSKIRADFKLPMFGHETLLLPTVPEVALVLPFYPQGGRSWDYFRSMSSGFRDMGRFSNLPYLCMKLGHWLKFQKLHIYSLSTPGGRNWAYFCSTGSGFRDTGWFSKLPYFGMKLGHWPKFQKFNIDSLNYPRSQISLRFALRLATSKILAIFPTGSHVKENFNPFFLKKKSNLKFQNSYMQVLCGLSQEMCRKRVVEKKKELYED